MSSAQPVRRSARLAAKAEETANAAKLANEAKEVARVRAAVDRVNVGILTYMNGKYINATERITAFLNLLEMLFEEDMTILVVTRYPRLRATIREKIAQWDRDIRTKELMYPVAIRYKLTITALEKLLAECE